MAKEYTVARFNPASIRKKSARLVQDIVPSKKDSKDSDNAPMRTKDQPAITAQGRSPRYDAGSIMGVISSLRSPGEVNEAYDPSKPVGGENVPYKPTTGIGGALSRFFGNQANEMNVAAQEQQAAEKKAEDVLAKERQAKKEDLAEEIALREKGPTERFKAEQKRLADKDIREEERYWEDQATKLAREGQEDVLKDVDRALKLSGEEKDRALRERALDIQEKGLKPARYTPLGNTGLFQTPEGDLGVYEPATMAIGKMPGRPAGIRMLPKPGSAPVRSIGEAEVDRITGKPIVKSTTPEAAQAPAPENTALFPTVGRALGGTATEAVQTVSDPLRAAGTELYKNLFSSQAEQDPEVLARMKRREELSRTARVPRFQNIPLGF